MFGILFSNIPKADKHYQFSKPQQILRAIIETKDIRTVFQPIVSLVEGDIVGYEALSRGPEGSPLEQPDAMFKLARESNLIWELDYLCRIKALEKAREMERGKMLFLNIDPKSIDAPLFQKGLTRGMLEKNGLDAENIIFEITEKTAIEDFTQFRKVLDNYTSQGYKIAIDDTGSGYSGLRMLAQTYPHYIKVDMELVRDIDKDGLKQGIMRALNEFALITNSKIIAEGIETREELITLINIGIPYGQGYFLGKPAPSFLTVSPAVRQLIILKREQKRRENFHTPLTIPIGEIARRDKAFSPKTPGYKAIEYFNANPNIQGVAVVDGERPVGLLMKNNLLASLATQYGVAVYMNRPINLLMEWKPLIVDYYTPLEQVAKSALARTDDSIYDYIIIVAGGKYWGITTIKRLLEKTSQLELSRAKHANPLTGLPGNVIIEGNLRRIISSNENFAVLYFDLDNFKAYNDVYGFENGDKVLCATANLIKILLDQLSPPVFLGHIGGDDFVGIVRNESVADLCQKIIDNFDSRIKDFYTEQDKRQGYITTTNRHGIKENFPLVSLSIAVVTNKERCYSNPDEIAEMASSVKKRCKTIWRSCYEIS